MLENHKSIFLPFFCSSLCLRQQHCNGHKVEEHTVSPRTASRFIIPHDQLTRSIYPLYLSLLLSFLEHQASLSLLTSAGMYTVWRFPRLPLVVMGNGGSLNIWMCVCVNWVGMCGTGQIVQLSEAKVVQPTKRVGGEARHFCLWECLSLSYTHTYTHTYFKEHDHKPLQVMSPLDPPHPSTAACVLYEIMCVPVHYRHHCLSQM